MYKKYKTACKGTIFFADIQIFLYLCAKIVKYTPVKVGILGTTWPYRGGLAAFNERLARQIVADGNEVEIFTFTLQYPDSLFPGKTQYSDAPKPEDLPIRRTMNSIGPLSWIRTARAIKNAKIDLLIIKFWIPLMAPCLGSIARIARRNGKTRVVSILDNVLPHEKRPMDKLLVRYFVGSIDCFVAMSDSVLSDLRLFDRHKPAVLCPHPLYDHFGERIPKEQARTKLNIPQDKTILLFFGFIRDYKGLDLLMQAYADPRIDKEQVRLVVAGEFYNNSAKYFELEEQLRLRGTIDWHTDFIPDSEVATYFSAADLIVQPYKSATQSGVTQIAYHFEKPMLVTRVGGLAEIVPDGKVGYVTDVDAREVADALVDFCHRTDKDCFRSGIQEEKQKYAWSRMTAVITNTQP